MENFAELFCKKHWGCWSIEAPPGSNLCHLLTRRATQLKFSTGHVSAKALEDHVSRDELAFLVRIENRRVQLLSRVAVKPQPVCSMNFNFGAVGQFFVEHDCVSHHSTGHDCHEKFVLKRACADKGLGAVVGCDAKNELHFYGNAAEWCVRFSAESTSRSSPNKRVYSAKHETIGRRAAVKVLKPEVAADAEWTQRFLTEARAIAALKHRNLIEVINFGKTPDNRQYLMPGGVRKLSSFAKNGLHFYGNAVEWCMRFSAKLRAGAAPNKAEFLEGEPLDGSVHRMGYNSQGHPEFESTRTEVGEALYLLKSKSDLTRALPLAQAIADHILPRTDLIDVIVPMAPSKMRLIQPVFEVARQLGVLNKMSVGEGVLVRVPGGPLLKDLKTKDEKVAALATHGFRLGVEDVFSRFSKVNVLLVDDLYQTGATLKAGCNVLRTHPKVDKVFVAVLTWRKP
jgi:predicted amidophosphoribosyltransferase